MKQSEQIEQISQWLGTGSINIFGMFLSGKDTQGARLGALLNAPVIGGGEILRNSATDEVKKIINAGELAPQDAYLAMVLPYLRKDEFEGKPLILSSVGRWDGEQNSVIQAAKESSHPLKAVILINISEGEVRKRWKALQNRDDRGKRADDSKEAVEKRFQEFTNKTIPVIENYRALGLLIEVNGEQPRDNVTDEIIAKLSQFYS